MILTRGPENMPICAQREWEREREREESEVNVYGPSSSDILKITGKHYTPPFVFQVYYHMTTLLTFLKIF